MAAPGGSALDWEGQTVLDRAGEKIGRIEEIFLVAETDRPEWALVRLGRLRGHTTLVPLTTARAVGKGIKVQVGKDVVGDAPAVRADAEPSEQEVERLYRHYGLAPAAPEPADGGATVPGSANGSATATVAHGSSDLRDEPIAELLTTVRQEGATLVGQEVRLAKAELSGKAKDVGIGAGMVGGAGYVANLAAVALMLTLIFALAELMAPWLAALIVTVLFATLAALLALAAKKKIQQAGPPIPEQTVASVKQTIQTVKEEARWGLGQTRK